jgi:adenylate kinase family enzyme
MGLGLNRAIFLDVEKSIAMKRLRKKAEKDSKSFDEEKEEKRFQDYEVKTLPVIDQYKKSRKVLEIKDLGDSQKITQNIVKKLGVSTIKDKLKKEE